MEWSEETITQLKSLWAEGHSTAEIGRRMGVSKNAVVGKAHRLNLSSRPSPIRRGQAGSTPRRSTPRRVVGPTLPPLAAAVQSAMASSVPAEQRRPEPARQPEPAPKPAVLRPVPAPRMTGSLRPQPCCWPIGEPGTSSFRFCDEPAAGGKPYCAAHVQLAYVRVRDRREDAA